MPNGLPGRLAVGLVSDPSDTWMPDSGVGWDMRYHYFTKGWRDNWGWDPTNTGQWGLAFLAQLGLEANVTGGTYDLLVGDPLDRD